jgi:hypothetical protein
VAHDARVAAFETLGDEDLVDARRQQLRGGAEQFCDARRHRLVDYRGGRIDRAPW